MSMGEQAVPGEHPEQPGDGHVVPGHARAGDNPASAGDNPASAADNPASAADNLASAADNLAEHYRSLVEDSSDFTIRMNAERVVEWISRSVQSVIGFTAEEIIGRSGYDFIHPDTHEDVRSLVARRDAGERVPARLQVLKKDGSYLWMYQAATIIYDAEGKVTGSVGAFRSIDEQVRLEMELAEAEARFRQLADRAEEVEEANQRLLTMTWTDYLTGLATRSRIENVLDSELGLVDLIGGQLCVALISVDGLPELRSVSGHRAADAVIAEYADVVREHLAPNDVVFEAVGRWADDQFIAILSGTSFEQAREVAERTGAALEARAEQLGGPSRCSVVITEARPLDTSDTLTSRLAAGRYQALDEGLGIVEML